MCKCVIVAGETVIRCAAHAPREIGININIDPDYADRLKSLAKDLADIQHRSFRAGGIIGHVHSVKDVQGARTGRMITGDGSGQKADPLSSGDFDFKIDASK